MSIIKFIIYIVFLWQLLAVNCVADDKNNSIEPAVQVLLGKLFSPVEKERINAALRLADYSHPQVVQNLIRITRNDKSEMVRRVALRTMGKIGNSEALPVIIEAIESDLMGVKIEALSAAAKFHDPAVAEIIIKKTDSKNPIIRQKAVLFLGGMDFSDDRISDVILNKLDDISEGVRVSATKVVGKKKLKYAMPALGNIIKKDRSEVVRQYAVQALCNMKDRDAKKILEDALEDSSPVVRITAAKGLALVKSKAGLGEAIDGIKSQDARIRIIACEVIGLVGDNESEIFLRQALQDFDRRVQKMAENAIRELNKRKKSN